MLSPWIIPHYFSSSHFHTSPPLSRSPACVLFISVLWISSVLWVYGNAACAVMHYLCFCNSKVLLIDKLLLVCISPPKVVTRKKIKLVRLMCELSVNMEHFLWLISTRFYICIINFSFRGEMQCYFFFYIYCILLQSPVINARFMQIDRIYGLIFAFHSLLLVQLPWAF